MGEAQDGTVRVYLDRSLKLDFHSWKVTSDAGLLAYRELDEAFELTTMTQDILDVRPVRGNHRRDYNASNSSTVVVGGSTMKNLG